MNRKRVLSAILIFVMLLGMGGIVYGETSTLITISGIVVDSDSNPIAEATVEINQSSVPTNELGEYSIEIEVAAEYSITATKVGYAHYTHTISNAGQDSITHQIVLSDHVIVSGIIKDGAEKPLANMTVNISGEETTTDADGHYTLGVLVNDTGAYEISILQNGYAYLPPESIELNGPNPILLDKTLSNYYAITGSVTDNGEPAVLQTLADGEHRGILLKTTSPQLDVPVGQDGTFSFIGQGACDIIFERQGQYWQKTVSIIDVATQVLPVEIALERVKAEVHITDEAGAPVSKFQIITQSSPLPNTSKFFISETGQAIVDGFDAESLTHQLTIKADGYADVTKTVDFSLLSAGETAQVAVEMKTGKIKLTLKHVNESKISGLNVAIDDPNALVTSNEQGVYTISNVGVDKNRPRRIIITGNDAYMSQNISTVVYGEEEMNVTGYVPLKSINKTGMARGNITDGTNGVEGVVVRIGERVAITDAQGAFTVSDIPVGQAYDLIAEKKGYEPVKKADQILFTIGGTTQQNLAPIQMTPSNTIKGSITDAGTAQSVKGAQVTLSEECRVFVADDGRFEIEGVSSQAQIAVSAPGYAPMLTDIIINGTNQTITKDIELTATTTPGAYDISGTLININGDKLVGAAVSEPISGITTLTDEKGRFALAQLTTMPTQISINANGYTQKTFSISYDEGAFSMEDTFVLNKAADTGVVSGTVYDHVHIGLADATVYAYIKDASGYVAAVSTAVTDSNGAYILTGLEEGVLYQICAVKDGFAQIVKALRGGTTGNNFSLPNGGSVLVTVNDSQGQPLVGIPCYVSGMDRVYRTNAQGQIEVEGLAYGVAYDLIAKGDPEVYRPTKTSLQILEDVDTEPVELTCYNRTSQIYLEGRVLDANTRAPLANAIITVAGNPTFTDANGYYKIYGLTKGATVSVTATKSGYNSATTSFIMHVGNNGNALDVGLNVSNGRVYGRVFDESGAAMKDVLISSGSTTVSTDVFGYYSINVAMSATAIPIVATKTGYQSVNAYGYISKTAPVLDINLGLPKSATLTVELFESGSNNKILSGTAFVLKLGDVESKKKSATIVLGKAEIKDLLSGDYKVWAASAGYTTSQQETVHLSGENKSIAIYLAKDTSFLQPGGPDHYTPLPTKAPVQEPVPKDAVSEKSSWAGFQDLNDTVLSWAVEPVNGLVTKGVIAQADYFRPTQQVRREEYIKMLVVAFGLYDQNAQCNFSDASASDWYYRYVASAYTAGILQGYEEGSFGAGRDITRQDLCVMTYRASQKAGVVLKPVKAEAEFSDGANIAEYAKEAVKVMQLAGIVNGMGDGTFAPSSNATRAQSAKIMWGLIQTLQK